MLPPSENSSSKRTGLRGVSGEQELTDNPSDAAINVCASLKIKILAGPASAVGPKRKGTLIDSPPGPPGMADTVLGRKSGHLYTNDPGGKLGSHQFIYSLSRQGTHILIFIL